jgi:hypothetical protein
MKPLLNKAILLIFCLVFFYNCSKDEVNLAPVIENQTFTISEGNLDAGIGNVVATDENDSNLNYSIVSQSVTGAIDINSNTGELIIADATAFDFEINQSLTTLVKVDDGDLEAQATITVIKKITVK